MADSLIAPARSGNAPRKSSTHSSNLLTNRRLSQVHLGKSGDSGTCTTMIIRLRRRFRLATSLSSRFMPIYPGGAGLCRRGFCEKSWKRGRVEASRRSMNLLFGLALSADRRRSWNWPGLAGNHEVRAIFCRMKGIAKSHDHGAFDPPQSL